MDVGGGYLLAAIDSSDSFGIEINNEARAEASKIGINTVKDSSEIPDEWADIIISNHALEYVFRPLDEIKALYKKLKKGGKIVFVVPQELKNNYCEDDINQHLYTWTPQNLGNIFKIAGFQIDEVKVIKHRWPPQSVRIKKYFGHKIFDLIAEIYGRLKGDLFQIRIVARKF